MSDTVKLVPPLEKVRLRKLTATDGTVYVGVEIEARKSPRAFSSGLSPRMRCASVNNSRNSARS